MLSGSESLTNQEIRCGVVESQHLALLVYERLKHVRQGPFVDLPLTSVIVLS